MKEMDANLMAYIDRELSPEEAQAVEAGLSTDHVLAEQHRELAQIAQVLRSETVDIPVTGFAETLAAIKTGTPRTEEAKAKRPAARFANYALVGVVLVVMVVPAMMNINPGAGPQADGMAQTPTASKAMVAAGAANSDEARRGLSFEKAKESLNETVDKYQTKAVAPTNGQPEFYLQPNLGPVLPPSATKAGPGPSRAPGSGERPLLALKDAPTNIEMPTVNMPTGKMPRGGFASGSSADITPLQIQVLPEVTNSATPTLASLEAEVRTLVASAKGSITGTSKVANGSRLTFTLPAGTASEVVQAMAKSLGTNATIEPQVRLQDAATLALKARAATGVPERDPEATMDILQKKLTDQLKKREDLLKDFYEDAKPIRTLDAEIAETKSQIEKRKKAQSDVKATFVVVLKPSVP